MTEDRRDTGVHGRAPAPLPAVGSGARLLLDLIARAEGTSDGAARRFGYTSGYDVTFAYGRGEPEGRRARLSEMTLDEVNALQRRMRGSSAVGRYQLLRGTLDGLRARHGLAGDAPFDGALQDRLGRALMARRGYDRCGAGRLGADAFLDGLAREWASLPMADGRSAYAYDGRPQPVRTTRAELRALLDEACRVDFGRGVPSTKEQGHG